MAKAFVPDTALPQTSYAHGLKPYDGELPSYIRKLDDLAKKAGLTGGI